LTPKQRPIRIMVVGTSGVGKTGKIFFITFSIIHKFKNIFIISLIHTFNNIIIFMFEVVNNGQGMLRANTFISYLLKGLIGLAALVWLGTNNHSMFE
jgi:hypothetical protein